VVFLPVGRLLFDPPPRARACGFSARHFVCGPTRPAGGGKKKKKKKPP